jgi:hypothetical protein
MHTTPVATRLFQYADIGPMCDCCDMCMQGDLYAHIAWQAELTPQMILPAFPHLNLAIGKVNNDPGPPLRHEDIRFAQSRVP